MNNLKNAPHDVQVCEVMRRIYDMDMTTLTGGNISLKDANGVVWMTPTSIDKANLRPEDIVRIYPDGRVEGAHKPTSEYRIHMGIYEARPDIRAVIHAHSPAMISMSILHHLPDTRLTVGAWRAVGEAHMVEYGIPGTQALSDYVTDVFRGGADCTILKNHGCFVASETDIFDAFNRFEAFDHCARLELLARASGEIRHTDPELLSRLPGEEDAALRASDAIRPDANETAMKDTLAALTRRAYKKKMFTALTGTISARTGADRFVVSRASRDNGTADADDFACVCAKEFEAGSAPDGWADVHRAIYAAAPDVGSIIFAAPVHAMVSAVTDCAYRVDMIPESYGVLRGCEKCSVEAFLRAPEKYLGAMGGKAPFLMIENCGILLAAKTPVLAFDKLEVCEYSAMETATCTHSGLPMHCMRMEELKKTDG